MGWINKGLKKGIRKNGGEGIELRKDQTCSRIWGVL